MSAPGRSSHPRSMIAVVVMAIVLESAVCQSLAWSEIPAIASRQRAEKTTFTNSQIAEGFFKTAFGAEYHLAGRVDRIRKYGGPVPGFAGGQGGGGKKPPCQRKSGQRPPGYRPLNPQAPTPPEG